MQIPRGLSPLGVTNRDNSARLKARPFHTDEPVSESRLNATTLQRSVSMHGKFGAVDHGRGDPEPEGATNFTAYSAGSHAPAERCARGAAPARVGTCPGTRGAQQIVGRVLAAGCAAARFCHYGLRQRGEGGVSGVAGPAHLGPLGHPRSGRSRGQRADK